MFPITQERIQCPVKSCDIEPTGLHRLITHFRGAHIKGKDSKGIEEAWAAINSIENEDIKKALLMEFSEYGPEMDAGDEEKADVGKCDGDDEKFIINGYLKDAICREERQYALFLANGLKRNNSEIKQKLKPDNYEIIEVFYEATLMRDYWCRNRAKFNEALKGFVKNDNKFGGEIDSNGKEEKHANYWEKKHPLACWMMNAKPDIAFLYREKGKEEPTLSLIECKYLSRVDTYYYNKGNDRLECSQVELQELILEFLCNVLKLEYRSDNVNKNDAITKGEVYLAHFVNSEVDTDNTKLKDDEFEVSINRLREIGY